MPANELQYERRYAELRAARRSGWLAPAADAEILGHVHRLLRAAGAAGGRLLELGCGAGNITLALAELGFEAVGIDVSPTAVAWAAERAATAARPPRFARASATDLGAFRDGHFDLVLDGLCLHALIGPDRAACLGEVRRVLRPGGAFLVLTMCNDPRPPALRARFDPQSRTVPAGGVSEVCLLPAPHILQELAAAGFTVDWTDPVPGDADRGDQDLLLAVCRSRDGRA